MKYSIKNDLLPMPTKRRSGTKIKGVKFLVAHDTGNPNSTAQGNVNYYKNSANAMSASAHVFIDEKDIIICVPILEKAWHVLYNTTVDNKMFNADANDYAIGVELCYFPNDKNRSKASYDRYVWYMAYLCHVYNLNPLKQIVGHHILDPGRKTDPVNALKHIGKSYNDLLNDINKELIECRQDTKGVEYIAPAKSNKPMWGKTEFKKGQIGKVTIIKPINLWKDVNGKLVEARVLNPGEEYRVYNYREDFGGQYNVGDGHWITKMPTHIKYETPSKRLLEEAEKFYK